MPRLLLLVLTLSCLALLATPAHAAELLAVLELSGDLPDKQRQALTDAVRLAATDATAPTGIKVMTQENMETLLTDMGMDASCISEGACEVDTLRNLQANYGVTGKVTDFGGRYLVTLQLYEMRGGTMMGSEQVNGTDAFVLATESVPAATRTLLSRLEGVDASVPLAKGAETRQGRTTRQTDATAATLEVKVQPPSPKGVGADCEMPQYIEVLTKYGDHRPLGKGRNHMFEIRKHCLDERHQAVYKALDIHFIRARGSLFLMINTLGLATPLFIHRWRQVKVLGIIYLQEYERQGAELVWGKRGKRAFGEESPNVYFDSWLSKYPKMHEKLEAGLPPVPE